jgi:predicted nucleic acid-binding protein
MAELGIKSIMLDTSFCIRLMNNTDPLHANALEYFKYFSKEKISMHISTIAIAEYAVGDDADNLPLSNIQIEAFDFIDSKEAGKFHAEIRKRKDLILGFERSVIANDVKILAQISTKKIDAIITKDSKSKSKYVTPLTDAGMLSMKFYDLDNSLNSTLGLLF